ncbi:MAG: response regulator [Bacteroidetes bacterium]|nr:MAG: response regulator [Bacteroidota bacterium]
MATTSVLIVDDEPHIVTALRFLVEQKGYQTYTAYNGLDGLALAKAHRPSVVILDVMMPGMDGYEVARAIRSESDLENTTIVFLSAKGAEKDKVQGYLNGGEIYLTKPFDNDEVINVISEVFEFG